MPRDLAAEIGEVTHDEAEQLALAYIDVAFNNPPKLERRVQHSIPVRASDTDVRLMHYIRQQRKREALHAGSIPEETAGPKEPWVAMAPEYECTCTAHFTRTPNVHAASCPQSGRPDPARNEASGETTKST